MTPLVWYGLRRAALSLLCAVPAWACAQQVPQRGGEPNVQRTVVEDDQVRVEELRVRGQVQRVVVSPKLPGAKAYEIVTGDAGRDPDHRGAVGQRVWNVFGF
jgi:hypothetical protein